MSRILVIDDEPSSRLLLQSRLKDQGYEVSAVENGAQGLLEARKQSFDLFVLTADLSSGITATEVCRRLKQTPQTAGIPVVVVSSRAQTREELHQGYAAGCESYLMKSDMPSLEDVIRAWLRAKSQQDDLARQIHAQEDENRRLYHDRARGADLEASQADNGEHSLLFREIAAGHPDGIMMVDGEGIVRLADRGAHDLLGNTLEGKNLGSLAPASGLEAFVRDARTDVREGFRFDFPPRNTNGSRALTASVIPLVSSPGVKEPGLRVVLILDAGKRRVAAELLGVQEDGMARPEIGVLMELARESFRPSRLLGQSPGVQRVREVLDQAASHQTPVLFFGERGVGKTFASRCLHFGGARSGPFIPVDCAALSPSHLERSLFGHIKGAFAEAMADRPGIVQRARHGTVLLQSLDEASLELQAKILRVLKTNSVRRLGCERSERVDMRLTAEIRDDPDAALADGRLLPEFFSELEWLRVEIPPLRERHGDVRLLTQTFLERYGGHRQQLEITEDAMRAMESYEWPGNVRELASSVDRACSKASGTEVGVDELSQPLRDVFAQMPRGDILQPAERGRVALKGTHTTIGDSQHVPTRFIPRPQRPEEISLEAYEKQCLLDMLGAVGGDKLEAARKLGIGKSTLYRKLHKYQIR